MAIFDRRAPHVTPQPRRYTCEHCAWFSYDAELTLDHMRAAHPRRYLVALPAPGSVQSEWVRRARAGLLPPKAVS